MRLRYLIPLVVALFIGAMTGFVAGATSVTPMTRIRTVTSPVEVTAGPSLPSPTTDTPQSCLDLITLTSKTIAISTEYPDLVTDAYLAGASNSPKRLQAVLDRLDSIKKQLATLQEPIQHVGGLCAG